jgi:hypothetical protein
MKGFFVQSKYNYREKVAKAMEDGNVKYLKMLIKKGKLIPFDTDEI